MQCILSEGGSGINEDHPGHPDEPDETCPSCHAYSVNGIGIEKAAAVAMRANMYHMLSTDQYEDAARAWVHAAIYLAEPSFYGYSSLLTAQDVYSVCDAWNAVGFYPNVLYTFSDGSVTFE